MKDAESAALMESGSGRPNWSGSTLRGQPATSLHPQHSRTAADHSKGCAAQRLT